MKIGGVTLDGPKKVLLVIPRESGDLVFKFVAVTDDDEFDRLYPAPEAPKTFVTATQQTTRDYKDPAYVAKMAAHIKARNAWIFLKSVESSNIEWETVNISDPNTFNNWHTDLKNGGLSINEVNQVWDAFNRANIVTDEMLNEARNRFLASQVPESSQTQ